jgi:hypothetical protein
MVPVTISGRSSRILPTLVTSCRQGADEADQHEQHRHTFRGLHQTAYLDLVGCPAALERDRVTGRATMRLAWSLCLLTVAIIVLGVLLQVLGPGRESRPEQAADVIYLVGFIGIAWCGALITARRPGNRIGLLLLVGSLSAGLGRVCKVWVGWFEA